MRNVFKKTFVILYQIILCYIMLYYIILLFIYVVKYLLSQCKQAKYKITSTGSFPVTMSTASSLAWCSYLPKLPFNKYFLNMFAIFPIKILRLLNEPFYRIYL